MCSFTAAGDHAQPGETRLPDSHTPLFPMLSVEESEATVVRKTPAPHHSDGAVALGVASREGSLSAIATRMT
jgi:hypothetical protein